MGDFSPVYSQHAPVNGLPLASSHPTLLFSNKSSPLYLPLSLVFNHQALRFESTQPVLLTASQPSPKTSNNPSTTLVSRGRKKSRSGRRARAGCGSC